MAQKVTLPAGPQQSEPRQEDTEGLPRGGGGTRHRPDTESKALHLGSGPACN